MESDEEITLKPCPFCGETPYLEIKREYNTNGADYLSAVIDCEGCGARMESDKDWPDCHYSTHAPTIAAEAKSRSEQIINVTSKWNNRR